MSEPSVKQGDAAVKQEGDDAAMQASMSDLHNFNKAVLALNQQLQDAKQQSQKYCINSLDKEKKDSKTNTSSSLPNTADTLYQLQQSGYNPFDFNVSAAQQIQQHQQQEQQRRLLAIQNEQRRRLEDERRDTELKSTYFGVSRERGRWAAYIEHRGTKQFLGRFVLEEDAARAYQRAALDLQAQEARRLQENSNSDKKEESPEGTEAGAT